MLWPIDLNSSSFLKGFGEAGGVLGEGEEFGAELYLQTYKTGSH